MRVEDKEMLIKDGAKLVQEGEKYLNCINKIYQTVEELANSSWKGEKADKYISEIEGWREPLIKLGNEISKLGQGIINAGNELEKFESIL